MFQSHLSMTPFGRPADTAHDDATAVMAGEENGQLNGMGADPAVPAPVPASGSMMNKLLIIGGIAVVVFLIMRQMNKKG
jgi:hypothetical protein